MADAAAAEVLESFEKLPEEAKQQFANDLLQYANLEPRQLSRRQLLALAGVVGVGSLAPSATAEILEGSVDTAAAADGVVSDIDTIKSGDGTDIQVENKFDIVDQSNRKLWSEQDRTVSVTGDYNTIQAAINNELPYLMRHKLTINVDTSYTSSEEVYVPPTIGSRLALGPQSEDTNVVIDGDPGSEPTIDAILLDSLTGIFFAVKGIEATGVVSWTNENVAYQAFGCRGRALFSSVVASGTTTVPDTALNSYASDVTIGGSNGLDFSNNGTNGAAITTKHEGHIQIASDVTGTAGGELLKSGSGHINVDDTVAPLSASAAGGSDRLSASSGYVNENYTAGLASGSRKNQGVTISSDAITVEGGFMALSGESASADDLTTINGGSRGTVITLRAPNEDITIKHGTDNIFLDGGADFLMDSGREMLSLLKVDSSNWFEIGRATNQ